MTDLFSAWAELPSKFLAMQQAYAEAMNASSDASQKMMAAMQANKSAAEAGFKALGSWTSLLNRAD